MLRRALAFFLTMSILMLCSVRVSAQQVITLPSGGLHRISAAEIDCFLPATFQMLTITLPPAPHTGILYLDGKPIAPNRLLTREEVNRLMLFSSEKISSVSFGVTVPGTALPQKNLRIRCINRTF